jgi:pSer/pThr/pTyr-binding forkhead associated (FHA) protein
VRKKICRWVREGLAAFERFLRTQPEVDAPGPGHCPSQHLMLVSSGRVSNSFFCIQAPGTIGRSPESIVPLQDQTVDARHAQLLPGEGCFRVRDLGSQHGTFVRLTQESEIHLGIILEFGSLEVVVDRAEAGVLVLRQLRDQAVFTVALEEGRPLVLGRNEHADLAFPKYTTLSSFHCEFRLKGGRFFVADMGSTNGTWQRLSLPGQVSPFQSVTESLELKFGATQAFKCRLLEPIDQPLCKQIEQQCPTCALARNAVLRPCGHSIGCLECSKGLEKCPVCAMPVH